MEKKKIGILSLYYKNPNCGAQLQAFAMCKVMNKLGYEAEQICLGSSSDNKTKKEIILQSLKTNGFVLTVKKIMHFTLLAIVGKVVASEKKHKNAIFHNFEISVPHSEKVFYPDNITATLSKYDFFVTGSDQVWNWNMTCMTGSRKRNMSQLDVYMLKFVPDTINSIAYAASIACPYLPDDLKQYYIENVKRIKHVSLRESASLDLFPEEISKDIPVVLDPTLLLNADEWCNELGICSGSRIQKPYIFCYFFDASTEECDAAKSIARELGLPIITRPNLNSLPFPKDRNLGDVKDFDMGPKEFVHYIRDAELVLTNSFHATVFSMQFHTPFYVFRRSSAVSMYSRLESVANDYDLKDRFLSFDFNMTGLRIKDIDWDAVDSKLNEKRQESFAFLKEALSSIG